MKNLVIVESPTKAKTISRFLGNDFEIKASMGHLMDLPKSTLGVSIADGFAPQYEVVADRTKIIAEIKAAAKKAERILLATDPDREGEAIAFHINALFPKNMKQPVERIVFHEITKEAIQEALLHPRALDINLVNAQTARRVLDRLVGYKLSPLLWKKIRRGLSAGRVQSVALRLIVEREKEIERFQKEQYFTIHAVLLQENNSVEFDLFAINDQKIEEQKSIDLYDGKYTITKTTITTKEQADSYISELQPSEYIVTDVSKKETKRSPQPPYTTSTLQQDAARKIGLTGKRTMSLAQKLYEEGYITYHRTDSVAIAESAQKAMIDYIKTTFGNQYLPPTPRFFANKQKLAQEAHEAIRPTRITVSQNTIAQELGASFAKLYELIWRRAVGSQMADARIESTTVIVSSTGKNNTYQFKTNGSVLLFDGFLKVNPLGLQDKQLPPFAALQKLLKKEVYATDHQTAPPPRYNEASLIKTLEEKGIGRPSTYATILGTIQSRQYTEKEENKFFPTPIGIAVNDFLVKNFSDIDDIPFTAQMEDELDNIAHGKRKWVPILKEFYGPFEKKLVVVESADRVKIAVEETGELCPECQSPLVVRHGKYGKFLSCSKFPECKFTKPFLEETGVICPKDGGKVIVKKTKKGRKFFGCSNYPNCDFAAWKLSDITPQVNLLKASE